MLLPQQADMAFPVLVNSKHLSSFGELTVKHSFAQVHGLHFHMDFRTQL